MEASRFPSCYGITGIEYSTQINTIKNFWWRDARLQMSPRNYNSFSWILGTFNISLNEANQPPHKFVFEWIERITRIVSPVRYRIFFRTRVRTIHPANSYVFLERAERSYLALKTYESFYIFATKVFPWNF